MEKYIIFGANKSGVVAYHLLKSRNKNVIGFIDKTQGIVDPTLSDEPIYKSAEYIPKDTNVILIAVGNSKLANELKFDISSQFQHIEIQSIYDEKYYKDFMKLYKGIDEDINKRVNKFFRTFLMAKYNNSLNRIETVNERPIEYSFAMKWLSKIYPKSILDIGSGKTAWPSIMSDCGFYVTAIDQVENYWKKSTINYHYHIIKDDITDVKLKRKFDFITCISVLEHIEESDEAINNCAKLLYDKGYLLLTFPYNEYKYVHNAYELQNSNVKDIPNYICKIYSKSNIEKWLNNGFKIIEQEHYKVFEGKYWEQGEKLFPQIKTDKNQSHHLTCLLLQKC
ncbi:methyltransferase domain-containing protein [Clostridium sp. ZS2-4]|uniref:methyltransferase domain-containing protein n=1 Tax=Clostridium sp. ZS2-4 TaxID=2987703 RepID=UPI00227BD828|nr:methyltransferase domain-containing protein [Clostridium sp. ZS2-4]MCY6353977.1 methyltransferase domain-containing protein [Clostridium sp. ZS2-4]